MTVRFAARDFFLCQRDNSKFAAVRLTKFSTSMTTFKSLLNFKVTNQRSRSHEFLCAGYCGYPRTVLKLEQGLIVKLNLCCGGWGVSGCVSVAAVRRTACGRSVTDRCCSVEHVV